ncbi:Uncharacterised protein [Mycobacteroides abscessus subsp. abscessus]|nr:Uncharacterised protein [Mycobacteroides abscessus subsp. abscessus]
MKSRTTLLMAPNVSLNRPEKIRMDTNAGTAHGRIRIVLMIAFPFRSFWLTSTARKTPRAIWNVVAPNVTSLAKLSNATQSISFAGH